MPTCVYLACDCSPVFLLQMFFKETAVILYAVTYSFAMEVEEH